MLIYLDNCKNKQKKNSSYVSKQHMPHNVILRPPPLVVGALVCFLFQSPCDKERGRRKANQPSGSFFSASHFPSDSVASTHKGKEKNTFLLSLKILFQKCYLKFSLTTVNNIYLEQSIE